MQTNIHEFLHEKRIEMNLSIQQLSKESGISASHISRIERGIRKPSPQTLEKLAFPLKVDYITLLKIANLLDNPNNKCVDLEQILLQKTCIFREKQVPPHVKEKILALLKEYV